jgi:hypothetical protein
MLPSPLKILTVLDRRLRRARAGSVLIIVIVLLLLLAILGAAYLSTTRSDRIASAQSVLSTNVDVMLDGIAKVCEGVIVDDLNDTFGNLHGNTANATNTIINRSFFQGQAEPSGTLPGIAPNAVSAGGSPPTGYIYNPGDVISDPSNPFNFYAMQGAASSSLTQNTSATLLSNVWSTNTPNNPGWQILNGRLPITANGSDPWLADRVPDPAGTGNPLWQFLTQSIQLSGAGLTAASILGTPFEDPTQPQVPLTLGAPGSGLIGAATPTYVAMPKGSQTPTFNAPALTIGANTYVAANASGDGIADALLFRIPGASYDGLTWYAGVRIIDNNSAINMNTAWSRDQDYTYTYAPPGHPPTSVVYNNSTANPAPTNLWNLFQTSVGLQELININDITGYTAGSLPTIDLNKLNAYRFNDTNTASGHPAAIYDPFDETAIAPNGNTMNSPPQAFDRGVP